MSLCRCIFSSLKRFSNLNIGSQRCISTVTGPLYFRNTQVLWAEPLKRKKKVDPMVIRQREERRKKKIERAIKKLEKNSSQLKPLDEMEVPLSLLQEKEMRTRTNPALSEEQEMRRLKLLKEWTVYKQKQHLAEIYLFDCLQTSANKALEELRKESEELWLEAIQIDPMLLPFRAKGPVETPPVSGFEAPDGEYINETRKWD